MGGTGKPLIADLGFKKISISVLFSNPVFFSVLSVISVANVVE